MIETKKELYIVEGLSAFSSLRQGINKQAHDVHCIQGKFINVHKASSKAVRSNKQCELLVEKLGCGFDHECDPELLRYSHIIIVPDPDFDGQHALTLLIGFFQKYLGALIEAGFLSVVNTPQFRVSREGENTTLCDRHQLQQLLAVDADNTHYSELKSVAQFNPPECARYLLDARVRARIIMTQE